MKIITETTDGQFLGHEFVLVDGYALLDDDITIKIEKSMLTPSGVRYITSNYIIDTQEI